jgi:hypothetical protein
VHWPPEKNQKARSDPSEVLRRRMPLLVAVFTFCFALAIAAIYQDLRGGAPGAMGLKYLLALLASASAFIGASVRRGRIDEAEKSNRKLGTTR